jgi:hypothetical protein
MAVYPFSAIQVVGTSQVKANNVTGYSLQELTYSQINTKYIVKAIDLQSSSLTQLQQPITYIEDENYGTDIKNRVVVPVIDAYQTMSTVILGLRPENIVLNGANGMEYTVKANAKIWMRFWTDNWTTAKLNDKCIENSNYEDFYKFVINKLKQK